MSRTIGWLSVLALCLALGAVAKDGRTYYDDALLAQAHDRISRFDWARDQVADSEKSAAWLTARSLEEFWDFVPPPEQLRALNVSFGRGCPDCGKEIFRKGGHYPWLTNREKPFKVTCPVCSKTFPENTIEAWDPDTLTADPKKGEARIDTGAGWADEEGNRYFFVGYYVFWQHWQRDILPGIRNLSRAYLLTGKQEYGRACAVMLAKIATDYPRFDYRTQSYHNGSWPAGINGRILDYIWENGVIGNLALAYDAAYPIFEDAELRTFLAGKGVDDPRGIIEKNMLLTMIDDLRRGFVRGNMGMHQQAMCFAAIVLDNHDPGVGPVTDDLREWLMTGDGNTEYLLWNGFYRDGHGGESSPGYSSGWCTNFYTVARLLPRLGVRIWDNPKVRKMADIGPDLHVAGVSCPSIGDCGTIFGAGRVGWSGALQGPAFTHYGDPRHAKVLQMIKATSRDLFDDLFDETAVARAAAGVTFEYRTRNLGGYGLAVLESRGKQGPRGACMYYGHAGGGHGHRDRLTVQLMAYGKPFLTDMGYPAHWLPKNAYWTSNTISHYCVVVNRSWQHTQNRGYLNTLADAQYLQLMDASAEGSAYPGVTSRYRRTAVLLDIDEESSYLLDLFRVQGGSQHDYSYHGPPFPEFSVAGCDPGPVQATGTLMGPDVAFGSAPKQTGNLLGDGLVVPLRRSLDVLDDDRPYAERGTEAWATYASGNTILTRKPRAVVAVDIPVVKPGAVKVFMSVYDYNAGSNKVVVGLGPHETELTWEPSGATGYRWISAVIEVPEPVELFSMKAERVGQDWVLVQDVVLTRNLDESAPRVLDARTSGFQYLFNVRRMRPQGMWSATWRDPKENLALTMTVPGGVAREAILADAEPELKPGHPDTLQYVLLRNMASDGQPADAEVTSAFVTVSEPHRGAAKVTKVEGLERVGGAVAVASATAVTTTTHTDLIHSSLDCAAASTWATAFGPFSATAELASVSVDDRGVRRACLINGTSLQLGDFRLTSAGSPEGRVEAVNHAANSITLDQPLKAPEAYVGRVLISGNELQRTSYTVTSAENRDGKAVVGFGTTLFLVQMAAVESVDGQARALRLGKLERVDGKQHQGRWLYNEDRTRGFRISGCAGETFTLEAEGADLSAAFIDADGDGTTTCWVSDIGPGDEWRLPAVTVFDRER